MLMKQASSSGWSTAFYAPWRCEWLEKWPTDGSAARRFSRLQAGVQSKSFIPNHTFVRKSFHFYQEFQHYQKYIPLTIFAPEWERCVKITEKVSFNIASYVYILSTIRLLNSLQPMVTLNGWLCNHPSISMNRKFRRTPCERENNSFCDTFEKWRFWVFDWFCNIVTKVLFSRQKWAK